MVLKVTSCTERYTERRVLLSLHPYYLVPSPTFLYNWFLFIPQKKLFSLVLVYPSCAYPVVFHRWVDTHVYFLFLFFLHEGPQDSLCHFVIFHLTICSGNLSILICKDLSHSLLQLHMAVPHFSQPFSYVWAIMLFLIFFNHRQYCNE